MGCSPFNHVMDVLSWLLLGVLAIIRLGCLVAAADGDDHYCGHIFGSPYSYCRVGDRKDRAIQRRQGFCLVLFDSSCLVLASLWGNSSYVYIFPFGLHVYALHIDTCAVLRLFSSCFLFFFFLWTDSFMYIILKSIH